MCNYIQCVLLQVREGADGDLHIGLRSFSAKTEQDALNLLFLGNVHRQTAETPMNHASSRSHCILSLVLEARAPGSDSVRVSKLHFVDLAGA
jgi:kinesin family protein 6/9